MVVVGVDTKIRFDIKPTEETADASTWSIVTHNPQTDNAVYDEGGLISFEPGTINYSTPNATTPGHWEGHIKGLTGYNRAGLHGVQLVRPEPPLAGDDPNSQRYHVIASLLISVVEADSVVQTTSEYYNPQS